jgi:hypothetical protein
MTLGEYRDLCLLLGDGKETSATKFFDEKIEKQGRDQIVVADESQMIFLIGKLLTNPPEGKP